MREFLDDLASVDVRKMSRLGLLAPGRRSRMSVWRGGRERTNFTVSASGEEINFVFDKRPSKTGYGQTIIRSGIVHTVCNFGGSRPWFVCPSCGRRRAKLVIRPESVSCRACLALSYRCSSESQAARAVRRAQRIRRKLGASVDLSVAIRAKPKGMHQSTFNRLLQELDQAESAALCAMEQWLRPGTYSCC